jgi:hypothetical protein
MMVQQCAPPVKCVATTCGKGEDASSRAIDAPVELLGPSSLKAADATSLPPVRTRTTWRPAAGSIRTTRPAADATRGWFSAFDADARIGDGGLSHTFRMNVSPLVRKVSFGAHKASESLFLNTATSGTATGPAATAYQPLVVDRTVGSPKSEPKRLASPIASSMSWRLAKTIQRPSPGVSSGPADDEGGAIANHIPMAAARQRANEKMNLPMPKRLETRSRIVAKSCGSRDYLLPPVDNPAVSIGALRKASST